MHQLKFEEGETVEQQLDSIKRAARSHLPLQRFMEQSHGVLKPTEQLETVKSVQRSRSKIRVHEGLEDDNATSVETHVDFVKVSMIKSTVVGLIGPIEKKKTELDKEVKSQRSLIRDHGMIIKNMQNTITDLQKNLKEFTELRQLINQNRVNINKVGTKVTTSLESTGLKLVQFEKDLIKTQKSQHNYEKLINEREQRQSMYNDNFEKHMEKLQNQIHACQDLVEQKHQKVQQTFGIVRGDMDNLTFKYEKYQESVKEDVEEMVKKIEENHRKELLKVDVVNNKMKVLKTLEYRQANLETNVRQLLGHLHSNEELALYLERALPIQLHLQVCDALRQVTGAQFHQNLINFENNGMVKLDEYKHKIKGHTHNVHLLANRLNLFLDHFKSECNSGKFNNPCPIFELGRDYFPNMPVEDQQYVCRQSVMQAQTTRMRLDNEWKQLEALKDQYLKLDQAEEDERDLFNQGLNNMQDYQIPLFQAFVMRHKYQVHQNFASMLYQFVGEDEFYDEVDEINDQIEGLEADLGDVNMLLDSGGPMPGNMNMQGAIRQQTSILEDDENQQTNPSNRSNISEKAQPAGPSAQAAQSQAKSGQAAAAKSGPHVQHAHPPRPGARPDARKSLGVSKIQSEDRRGRRATLSVERQGTSLRRAAKASDADAGAPTRGARGGAGAGGGRGKRGRGEQMMEMFVVHSGLDRKALKKALGTYQQKHRRLVTEYDRMCRRVKVLDAMIPQEIKDMNQMKREGKAIDFDDLAREQERNDDDRTIGLLIDRTQQKPIGAEFVEKKEQAPSSSRADILKSGKKKMKKALFKIKLSLSLAQQRQIKLKTINEARPQVQNQRADCFSPIQLGKIQEMIDANVDWVRVLLKTQVEGKIEDQDSHLSSQFHELKDVCLQNLKEVNYQCSQAIKKVETIYNQCQDVQESMREIQRQFKEDSANLIKFRQRLYSDIELTNKKMLDKQDKTDNLVAKFSTQCDRNQQIVEKLLESGMIDSLLLSQDLSDREKLNMLAIEKPQHLLGTNKGPIQSTFKAKAPADSPVQDESHQQEDKTAETQDESLPYQLNKEQALQENSFRTNDLTVQQLKLACLSYRASPVHYRDFVIAQSELVAIKDKLLIESQNLIKDLYRYHNTKFDLVQSDKQQKAQKDGIAKAVSKQEKAKIEKEQQKHKGKQASKPGSQGTSAGTTPRISSQRTEDAKTSQATGGNIQNVVIETIRYDNPETSTKDTFIINSVIKRSVEEKNKPAAKERRSRSQVGDMFQNPVIRPKLADCTKRNIQNIQFMNAHLLREEATYNTYHNMAMQNIKDQLQYNDDLQERERHAVVSDQNKILDVDENPLTALEPFVKKHEIQPRAYTTFELAPPSNRPKTGASSKLNLTATTMKGRATGLTQIDMGSQDILSRVMSNKSNTVEQEPATVGSKNILTGNNITVNVISQFVNQAVNTGKSKTSMGTAPADFDSACGYTSTNAGGQQSSAGYGPLSYMQPGGGTSGGAAQYFPMKINIINQARSRTPGCGQQRNRAENQTTAQNGNYMPLLDQEIKQQQNAKSGANLTGMAGINLQGNTAVKNMMRSRGNIRNFTKFKSLYEPEIQSRTDIDSSHKSKLGLRKSALSNHASNYVDYQTMQNSKQHEDLVVHSSSIQTAKNTAAQQPRSQMHKNQAYQYSIRKRCERRRKGSIEMELLESQKINHDSMNKDFMFSPQESSALRSTARQDHHTTYSKDNTSRLASTRVGQARPENISVNVYQHEIDEEHKSVPTPASPQHDYPCTSTLPSHQQSKRHPSRLPPKKLQKMETITQNSVPLEAPDVHDSLISRRLMPTYQANSTMDPNESMTQGQYNMINTQHIGPAMNMSDTERVKKEMEEMSFIGQIMIEQNKGMED